MGSRQRPIVLELDEAEAPQRSLLVAYLLCVVLGWVGAHRFYLGRYFSGLLYAVSFGLFFVGWAVDLLILPLLVRWTNQRLAAEAEAAPEPFRRRAERPIPEWAKHPSPLAPIRFVFEVVFFLFGPMFFTTCALMLGQYDLLVILAAALIGVALLGDAGDLFERYPTLEKVPGVGHGIQFLKRMTDFYAEHRPRLFLYYLLYPVTAPLMMVFSRSARREFGLFARVIGGLWLLVVARILTSYFTLFPPHLGWQDALFLVGVLCCIILIMMTLFLMPTMTTALALSAARDRGKLHALVAIGLLSAVGGAAAVYSMGTPVPYDSYVLLQARLGKDSFRDELTTETGMFLRHWQAAGKLPGEAVAVLPELTEKFRRHVGGIVVGNEARAFRVIGWTEGGDSERSESAVWLGVGLWQKEEPAAHRLLYLFGPNGKLYTRWDDLPPEIAARFEVIGPDDSRPAPASAVGLYPIRARALLGDLLQDAWGQFLDGEPAPGRHGKPKR